VSHPAPRRAADGATTGAALAAAGATGHALANLARLRRLSPHREPGEAPLAQPVTVLVPARDEAARIGACVSALLASTGLARLEVLVGDDGSADDTAEAARAAADGDPRLRVVPVPAPPPGWLGKPHACAHLVSHARGQTLVFADADVVVSSGALAAIVATLRGDRLDVLSAYPRLTARAWLGRLVQPLLAWSWLTFLPLGLAETNPRPSLVAAGGQLLAVDARAYRRAGGHAAVAGDVLEDLALARRAKAAGARVAIADASRVATCDMYASTRELVDGYTKSLGAAFGSLAGAAALAALAWAYVWPPVAAVHGLARRRWARAVLGAGGYAAGVAGRMATARASGGRPADAWTHPASIVALTALTAESVRRRRAGTATWKGRAVTAPARPRDGAPRRATWRRRNGPLPAARS
jgi:hypothetical protein